MSDHRFFTTTGFEFATLIALGGAAYGVAEAGEVMATASRITDADADWRWEDGEYIEDCFDDDDAFASAGWGTDEAYQWVEDNDPAHGDFF